MKNPLILPLISMIRNVLKIGIICLFVCFCFCFWDNLFVWLLVYSHDQSSMGRQFVFASWIWVEVLV
jgi:hypothetical protein